MDSAGKTTAQDQAYEQDRTEQQEAFHLSIPFEIQIIFERLGTLRCRFAEPADMLLTSRW